MSFMMYKIHITLVPEPLLPNEIILMAKNESESTYICKDSS